MNILPFEKGRRYYPTTCPVCAGTALEADILPRKVEFQCATCGAYEITAAARSAMKGMSQELRNLWLLQARQQASNSRQIAVIACANESHT